MTTILTRMMIAMATLTGAMGLFASSALANSTDKAPAQKAAPKVAKQDCTTAANGV